MNVLYIMQGIPGSGKSFIANHMQMAMGDNCVVYSTDEFHYEGDKYVFKPDKLSEFHRLNLIRSIAALAEGKTVIVDNTNITRWQCAGYVQFAVANNIPVVFVRVTGEFKSIHDVPQHKIDRMKAQMEELTIESVLASKAP